MTAIDPAWNMLALARRRLEAAGLRERCALLQATFPDVKVDRHDHAIVMGVMDYVPDPAAFLAALKPVITRSAVLSFPSEHWFRTPFRKMRYRLRRCPVYFYNTERIRTLCAAAHYSRIDIYKIPGAGMDYHVCLRP